MLNQLAIEDVLTEEFCTLSLNAILGTDKGEAMRLRALVHNKVMLLLVNSGSSHSFVNSQFLERVSITPIQTKPRQVKLANGESMISDHYVPKLSWWIQGYTFYFDMRVIDMGAYDAILGFDWLSAHSPINHHWAKKTMEFLHNGVHVHLKGLIEVTSHPQQLSSTQLVKWCAGNDIWAWVIVEQILSPLPSSVQAVLEEYQDVFGKPQGLPPSGVYDHFVPLLPNSLPVNSRPYRYSPLHKDEIERQVKELLGEGLIIPSSSPFASPFLLVQKKRMVLGDFV